MRPEEERLLKYIVKGMNFPLRKKAQNPVSNPMWLRLLEGAAQGLDIVATATFDWKLVGIAKLLKSWLNDKREDYAEEQQKSQQNIYRDPSSGFGSYSYY